MVCEKALGKKKGAKGTKKTKRKRTIIENVQKPAKKKTILQEKKEKKKKKRKKRGCLDSFCFHESTHPRLSSVGKEKKVDFV
jgi:hypothetical protein